MWTWCRATILMALAIPAAARNNVVAHILPAAETRPWPPRASEAMTPPVPLPGPSEALSTVVAAFVQRAPRAARTKQAATRQAAAKQAATTKAEWKPVGCVDDALFIDATGYACSAWTQFSCVSQPGYTTVQLRDVQRNCPQACGQCRGGKQSQSDRLSFALTPSHSDRRCCRPPPAWRVLEVRGVPVFGRARLSVRVPSRTFLILLQDVRHVVRPPPTQSLPI